MDLKRGILSQSPQQCSCQSSRDLAAECDVSFSQMCFPAVPE